MGSSWAEIWIFSGKISGKLLTMKKCALLGKFFYRLHLEIVFCSPNFLIYYDRKFFYCDFSFSPSYRSRQKGTEGKFFEAEAAGRG